MADPLDYGPGPDYGLDADDMPGAFADSALASAEYLRDMTGQLEGLAKSAGFDLLAYLLAMARVEADAHARRIDAALPSRAYDA